MQNQSQVRRKCIFCGNTPSSKEHLWPGWLKTVVPKAGPDKHFFTTEHESMGGERNSPLISSTMRNQGHLSRKTLKIVCETCNNGWMSRIESEAKNVLSALILGHPFSICIEDQLIISKWAILRTIIGEFINESTKAITAKEYVEFYNDQKSPLGWYVWIGRSNDRERDYWYDHWSGGSVRATDFTLPILNNIPFNIQASTFSMLNLIIYTLKLPEGRSHYMFTGSLDSKLTKIWPLRKTSWFVSKRGIDIQKLPPLTKQDFNDLRYNLRDYLSLDFNL